MEPNRYRLIQDGQVVASTEAMELWRKAEVALFVDGPHAAAAIITALETALAEAEGRVIADVVAWLRGSLIEHYEEPSEWELAVETYATALETGEWKK